MATNANGQPIVQASGVLAQAERKVSASSVLVAWGVAVAGGVCGTTPRCPQLTRVMLTEQILIVLLYSWMRSRTQSSSFELIHESRIKYCKALASEQEEGTFVPLIPEVRTNRLEVCTSANRIAPRGILCVACTRSDRLLDRD